MRNDRVIFICGQDQEAMLIVYIDIAFCCKYFKDISSAFFFLLCADLKFGGDENGDIFFFW